jgi:adenosylcobinamide kinase/adenosylcobinamide-phosphate guanylyltransferase
MRTFLIGGARSGKSSLAAGWAAERSNSVCCVVTATASDEEMAARISAHRRERPQHWRVREEPLRLGEALREEGRTGDLLLVDCLTLWTANCLWPPARWGNLPQPSSAAQASGAPQAASVTQPTVGPQSTSAAATSQRLGDAQADLPGWYAERDAFLASLRAISNEVIVVSNEVGTGLVPENAAARLFRDEQGRLNQLVAAACDCVFLVTAGLALRLK